MRYGYARVSTNGQEYDHQLVQLREYAQKMQYDVVAEFSEKISGAKKIAERQALTELLAYVDSHKVDKVLVFEEWFPNDAEEHAKFLYTAATRAAEKLVIVQK